MKQTIADLEALKCRALAVGVGDVIHSVIMNNNGGADILTFDEKDDFKKIPDLTVLHPRDVTLSN